MNKIDINTFNAAMANGDIKEVPMWRIIGFNKNQNKYSTTLCFARNESLQIHAYPCDD
jgi:hypothetical protein